MRSTPLTPLLATACLLIASFSAGQATPYYIADGDSTTMWVVQNGQLQTSFSTFSIGYAVAVSSSIILGDRDATGAVEYSLAGVPTGNSWPGPGGFSEILDGTTDGTQYNYGIECCDTVNSVVRADLHWQNPIALFALPNNEEGSGITFDSTTGHLFTLSMAGTLREFTTTGTEVNSVTLSLPNQGCCLAYEASTDTLWLTTNGGGTIYQYSKAGAQLQSIAVPNFSPGNTWGGEMAIAGTLVPSTPIPFLGTIGLLLLVAVVAGLGFVALRLD